jgi:hypothetical protein
MGGCGYDAEALGAQCARHDRRMAMRFLLFGAAVLAFLYAAAIALVGTSAVHSIQAGVAFLTSMVCLSGAGLIEAVDRMRAEMRKLAEAAASRTSGPAG